MQKLFYNVVSRCSGSKTEAFDLSELESACHDPSLISFDFFDTLFVRPIADPEDLFDLLGSHYGLSEFRAIRKEAQKKAFENMIKAGRKEISLDEIYACIDPRLPVDEIMQREYDLELELLRPNPDIHELFQSLVAKGKAVVILSDMYLPTRFFSEALARHNLADVPVYVSADCNATKRDHGELFDVLVKQTNVPAGKILHIGDSLVSDVNRSRAKGLQAFHYQNSRRLPDYTELSLSASFAVGLLKTVKNKIDPETYPGLGFLYGGSAALGFVQWIAEQVKTDKPDHILFLARDGYILNKIVDSGFVQGLPPSHYFKASRVVFLMAAITTSNFDQYLDDLLAGSIGLSPFELFARIGVSAPEPGVMEDIGLGDNLQITTGHTMALRRLLTAWKSQILKVCVMNRRNLYNYLQLLGIAPGSRVALVDIGWNGTSQEMFRRATETFYPLELSGYYYCLVPGPVSAERRRVHRMKSMITEEETSLALYKNRTLVELFFSAPHQAIIGLEKHKDQIIAVEDSGRSPDQRFPAITSEIIEGSLMFVAEFRKLSQSLNFQPTAQSLAWHLNHYATSQQWMKHPELRQLKNFDAWGSSRNRNQHFSDY